MVGSLCRMNVLPSVACLVFERWWNSNCFFLCLCLCYLAVLSGLFTLLRAPVERHVAARMGTNKPDSTVK